MICNCSNLPMIKIIFSIFLAIPAHGIDSRTVLNPEDIIGCIGQPFNKQTLFSVPDCTASSEEVKEEYFARIISKSLTNSKQFSLFGIPIDELHIGLDSSDKILAVYVRLKNEDLVKKMEQAIGEEYMGISIGAENAPPSSYYWDFKGKCVSLLLYANRTMFVTKRGPDDGLVTFSGCGMDHYIKIETQNAEADEPGFNNAEILKQKQYFLDLAYSFYPKGISDLDEIYGLTPQYRKMYETLRKNDTLDKKWEQLIDTLQQRYKCTELGYIDPIMRGYRIGIVLQTPKPHTIVVNISKLIPYYCFYTGTDRLGFYAFDNFSKEDQEIVNWVTEQIHRHFEGYSEFPPALPLVKFDNVSFEDRGYIHVENEDRSFLEPMRLFNAFFSSNIFYY